MRCLRGTFMILACLAPLGMLVAGSPNTQEIDEYVRQLGHDKFAKREAAKRALEGIGAPALEVLKRACTDEDPEVQRRARELVRVIEQRVERDLVLQPTMVQLSFRDASIPEAVAELARQSGYSILLGSEPAGLVKQKLTLHTGKLSFWEALDRLCEHAELTQLSGSQAVQRGLNVSVPAPAVQLRPGSRLGMIRSNSIVLISGKPPMFPTYYAGALRLRVLPPGSAGAPTDVNPGETVMALEVSPEPKLQGQETMDVHVIKALDDRNQPLAQVAPPAPAPRSGQQQVIIQNGNQVVIRQVIVGRANSLNLGDRPTWNGTPQVVPLRFKLPDQAGLTLAELQATLLAQIQTPPQPIIEVDEVTKVLGQRVAGRDGVEMTVIGCDTDRNGDVLLRVHLFPRLAAGMAAATVNLPVQVLPNGPVNPLNVSRTGATVGRGQFTLLDKDGNAYQLIASRVDEAFTGATYQLDYRLTLRPPRPGAEPRKLTYAASRLAAIELPFAVRNVPLADSQ